MFVFDCVCCVCSDLLRVCVVFAVVVIALCLRLLCLESVVIEQTRDVCVYIVISLSFRL